MVLGGFFTSLLSVKAKSRDEYLKEKFAEYADYLAPHNDHETANDRLVTCLRDLVQENSWEAALAQNTLIATFLFGFTVGAVNRSKERLDNFRQKFNHMQFEGQYSASRKLGDVMMLSSLKRGFSIGLKFCYLPTVCAVAIPCSLAYRNYVNPLDFALIFGTAGALYKANFGARAMAAGAIVASSLGLLGGCLVWSTFKLSGTTVREFRHWSTAKHKRAVAQLSDKSWDEWATKMTDFRSMHLHDQLHNVHRVPGFIEKEFDSIPDANLKPQEPPKSN